MSTKFSHQTGFQGPPPICRAPPDEPIRPPPPLPDTIPEIFDETYLAVFTPPIDIITRFPCPPTLIQYDWFGISRTYPDHVEVSLVLDPITLLLEITITTKRFDHILNVTNFQNVPLIAPDRLQTRLIEAVGPSGLTRNRIQVLQ